MSQIYSSILGPLVTMLVCFATGSFMLREGGRTVSNRLFGIINLLIFLIAATALFAYILPATANQCPALIQILGLFLPPICLHLVMLKLDRRGYQPFWLYVLAAGLAVVRLAGVNIQPAFWLLSAGCLIVMLTLQYRKFNQAARSHEHLWIQGLDLLLLLTLLSVSLNYPLTNLSFMVIPLVAYGLIQDLDRRLLKLGLLSSLLLTVLLLPIAANLTLLLRHLHELRIDRLAEWFYPYGLTPILTLVICLTVVVVSLQQARNRIENLLLCIFAMLWASLNLRDLMLIVMPTAAELLTLETGSIFQAGLLGVGIHLLARLAGVKRPRTQAAFYLLSAGLVLTGLVPGLEPVLRRTAAGEIVAQGPRIYIYLASMAAGIGYCFIMLLGALRRTSCEQASLQLKIVLASAVLALLIFLGNLPTYLGWRDYPFNYLNSLPLILLTLGVFQPAGASAYLVFSRALRTFLTLIYLLLLPLIPWLLMHYTGPLQQASLWSLPALISFLIAGFLSLAVLKLEQSRTETLIFSLICFCYALLNFDLLMAGLLSEPQVTLIISRIDHLVMVALLLGLNIHLVQLVCHANRQPWLTHLAYGLGFALAPFTLTELYFTGSHHYYWGHIGSHGPLFAVVGLAWLLGTLYCAVSLGRGYFRQTDPQRRATFKYIFIGFTLTAILSLLNIPAMYGYNIYPYGTLVFFSLGVLAYGLFKHNFRATLQFVRRLLFGGGLALLLTALYYLPHLLSLDSHETMHQLGFVLVIILGLPLIRLWNGLLSLFITHAAEDLRQDYSRLSSELGICRHRQEIHSCLSRWLFEVLGSSRCQSLLRRDDDCFEGWLNHNPATGLFPTTAALDEDRFCIAKDHPLLGLDLASHIWEDSLEINELRAAGLLQINDYLLPVHFQGRLTALIIVGGKLNGAPYFWSERQTLRALTELLGAHLENARLLEGLEATVAERTMELNRSLADAMRKEKELRAKGQIISRQNLIMRVLIETSNSIQQLGDVEQIMSLGLEQIHRLFNDQGSLLLIEPENRPAYVLSRNLSASEEAYLIDNRATLMDEDLNSRLAGAVFDLDASRPGFTALPLKGLGDQALGKALIRLAHHADNDLELLELFLNRISIQAQSQLLIDELARLASTDSLTGVHNRAYFNQELERAGRQYKRYPQSGFSLMILDINGLKEVNDTYGHMKGDEMIVSVAEYLKRSCRATDIIARLGGDEFAVLMPTTDRAQAETLLARFRAAKLPLECQKPDGETETLPVSFSIGLAATEEVEVDKIMNTADDRMYQDKEGYYQNRNRYR